MTTLDTSGVVRLPQTVPPTGTWSRARTWEDLSPFAQGYVEAVFAERFPGGLERMSDALGFSDLAPEALAMILRDCEAMQGAGLAGTAEVGRSAWSARQAGLCTPDFQPLCVYLNDAGKVMLA